jgi:hypothetical protein
MQLRGWAGFRIDHPKAGLFLCLKRGSDSRFLNQFSAAAVYSQLCHAAMFVSVCSVGAKNLLKRAAAREMGLEFLPSTR